MCSELVLCVVSVVCSVVSVVCSELVLCVVSVV